MYLTSCFINKTQNLKYMLSISIGCCLVFKLSNLDCYKAQNHEKICSKHREYL